VTARAKEWTVQHLPWIVTALVALWLPPPLYCIAVDIGLVEGAGYPRLTDPSTFLPVIELSAMIAAIPLLIDRKASGWMLLVVSRLAVLAQTLWVFAVGSRLTGVLHTLGTRTVVVAVAGLLLSAYVLLAVRSLYAAGSRVGGWKSVVVIRR
jgi:hypothetical protein